MTDPNVNPNGQVPGQQADANPTEPLNAMTGEAGTAANNAPTQALAAGEQPTQAFTPVEQPTQAFTPSLLRRPISRYRLRRLCHQ